MTSELLAQIETLSEDAQMSLMLHLSQKLGYVCLEGYDFEERGTVVGRGYTAFIYKENAGCRCQTCKHCVQIEDGTYVCTCQNDKPVEVNDLCDDFEEDY